MGIKVKEWAQALLSYRDSFQFLFYFLLLFSAINVSMQENVEQAY